MNGGSLASLLESKDQQNILNWNEKIEILENVANALCDMHSRTPPIIHRDIKPENILLFTKNGEWVAKLADFGISKSLKESQANTSIGSHGWASPEVFKGEYYGTSADIFSFGIVMWQMLLNQPKPFILNKDEDYRDSQIQLIQGERPIIPNLNEIEQVQQVQVKNNSQSIKKKQKEKKKAELLDYNNLLEPSIRNDLKENIGIYVSLMQKCWSQYPASRPSGNEIIALLRQSYI